MNHTKKARNNFTAEQLIMLNKVSLIHYHHRVRKLEKTYGAGMAQW